jgi:hypothetical protein
MLASFSHRRSSGDFVMDLVFVAMVLVLTAATVGLARLCDRLIGGDRR